MCHHYFSGDRWWQCWFHPENLAPYGLCLIHNLLDMPDKSSLHGWDCIIEPVLFCKHDFLSFIYTQLKTGSIIQQNNKYFYYSHLIFCDVHTECRQLAKCVIGLRKNVPLWKQDFFLFLIKWQYQAECAGRCKCKKSIFSLDFPLCLSMYLIDNETCITWISEDRKILQRINKKDICGK